MRGKTSSVVGTPASSSISACRCANGRMEGARARCAGGEDGEDGERRPEVAQGWHGRPEENDAGRRRGRGEGEHEEAALAAGDVCLIRACAHPARGVLEHDLRVAHDDEGGRQRLQLRRLAVDRAGEWLQFSRKSEFGSMRMNEMSPACTPWEVLALSSGKEWPEFCRGDILSESRAAPGKPKVLSPGPLQTDMRPACPCPCPCPCHGAKSCCAANWTPTATEPKSCPKTSQAVTAS